jgi:GGDEF domain-containing protein
VVADRLHTTAGNAEIVGRYGGEEFALIVSGATDAKELAAEPAAQISSRPAKHAAEPAAQISSRPAKHAAEPAAQIYCAFCLPGASPPWKGAWCGPDGTDAAR